MNRDPKRLSNHTFDVLIVGGGIYGAIAAWDAALRGLSVALIDRGDFGGATSQNSLKVIHGGLRYLQDGNLQRVRRMATERTIWMKIAPHLVHPLLCITPTYPKLTRGRLAMTVAMNLNDLLSYDRNQLTDPEKYLPAGRVIDRAEFDRLLPGFVTAELTGAAIWHDAQMHNSERLLLAFVISADRAGAEMANYMEATSFLIRDRVVVGVRARDVLSDEEYEIHAKVVVNCAGVWIDQMLGHLEKPGIRSQFPASVALNLITHQLWRDYAIGLPSRPVQQDDRANLPRRSHMFFIVPWLEKSIIGTWHLPWSDTPDAFEVSEGMIGEFIGEVNSAHPDLKLSLADIQHVHWGFLPMVDDHNPDDRVRLLREGRVIDHQIEDGLSGLVSLVGVKYTTARTIAEQGIDLVVKKLGLKEISCQTHKIQVIGGQIDCFNDFLAHARNNAPGGLTTDVVDHLVYTYGSEYGCILDYLIERPDLGERVIESSPVIRAEVVHAVRREMAQTLTDVIQRRTELGAAGLPDLQVLKVCAGLVADELGWNAFRQAEEIESVNQAYPFKLQERQVA